jgi:hypothetical protein
LDDERSKVRHAAKRSSHGRDVDETGQLQQPYTEMSRRSAGKGFENAQQFYYGIDLKL